jgi:AcrR family transcriptional regulator
MTRHAPQQQREAEILRAARKVLVEKGYRDARMEDVARAAGLSKGAVYFYFDSKRALFTALVEQEHRQAAAILDEVVQHVESSPAELLVEMLESILGHLMKMRSPRFFLIMAELSARDPELGATWKQVHESLLDRIEAIIAHGVEAGVLRPVNPRVVATVLKACSDGLACERAMGADPEGDPDQVARDVIQLYLHGMIPQPA